MLIIENRSIKILAGLQLEFEMHHLFSDSTFPNKDSELQSTSAPLAISGPACAGEKPKVSR